MRLLSLVKAYKVPYYNHVKAYNVPCYNYKKPAIVGIKTFCTLNFYKKSDVFAPIMPDDSDVKSKDLYEKVSEILNVKYLSDTTQELDEVNGILYGYSNRFFGVMTMNINDKIKNLIFLIDTGSPKTYITKEVLDSYLPNITNTYNPFSVILNKRHIAVNVSPVGSTFSDLNILGTDYMSVYRAKLDADFKQKNFSIKFKSSY
ncbi:hypothetical protein RhiirA5_379087 [Rhizophagus irregularis]|uniref:Peptidase A2 domain-containing protein n=2 Tax=Rhizophagus irregularis TaxID=588596 RepID=A0A2I1EIW2_9GLOM|nr:hypothetical protein RhiirA5_379087 [Rhizophagus irregularis]PKY22058.1 hypothetical protein RhiirB3_386139 [Rhizophagus irregularis]CAB4483165.1 unnamed protein product [Rhizophagus irregularis]CAB5178905.1 unnamed protein product [Rhizophagus irregularis]CAB5382339.1 unnamed protein product [Rhizophagus irregularis]